MCTDVDRNDKSRICVPGQRARDRPPPDRDVLAADPHRRPRRGPPAPELRRARRVPRPRLGGDRHRRAQDVGDAVHRGPRALAARLVRRRRRPARLRRQPEHRPHAAHRSASRTAWPRCGPARRCSTTPIPRPRRTRDAAQGVGASSTPSARPRRATRRRPRAVAPQPGAGQAHPARRPPGFVRAHAGQLPPPDRRRGRHAARAASRRARSTTLAPRPGRALAGARHAERLRRRRHRWRRCVARGLPVFGVCLGLQGMVEHFGGELGRARLPDARQGLAHPRARRAACSRGCPTSSPPAATTRCYAIRDGCPPALRRDRRDARTAWSWRSSTPTLPLAAVQFHPESIMTLGEDVGLRLLANVMSLLARGV